MDTVYLVDLVAPMGLLLLAACAMGIGLWLVELLAASPSAAQDQDSEYTEAQAECKRLVYVVIWHDMLAVRDTFVVSDRAVADHLSRWASLGKHSVRGTPVVNVAMVVCRIDNIPADLLTE